MRHLPTIIDEVLRLIPYDFEFRVVLSDMLLHIADSYHYASPEGREHWWREFGDALTFFLRRPDTEWKMAISNLIAGKSPSSTNWIKEGF